jgi:translation elongation factor EF-1beta
MKRIPNTNLFLPDTTTPEVIDLDQLKARLAELQAQNYMQAPSDEELMAFGRMMHPFYSDAVQRSFEIQRLQNLITELEGL